MTKKIVIAIIILFASIFISTYAFAENDMQKAGEGLKDAGESVRGAVGGVENAAEGAAAGAGNAIKSGLNTAGDATKNTAEGIKNGVTGTVNNMKNDGYTATRTSAWSFAGMNGSVWTWFILGIVALAIIGLVWYYSSQSTHSSHHDS